MESSGEEEQKGLRLRRRNAEEGLVGGTGSDDETALPAPPASHVPKSRSISFVVDLYLRLHCEADWREKQIKVMGYFTRLTGLIVGHFADRSLEMQQIAQRLSLASAFFSTSRRLLWLGRIVQNLQWLRAAIRETDTLTRWISLAGIGFGSVCNILDDLITLDRVGILASGIINVGKMLTATSRLWMSLTLCTFALNRIRLNRLSKELENINKLRRSKVDLEGGADQELESNLFQIQISSLSEFKLIADLCMNVCYSFDIKMGDGWFASCGLVSGLLAMRKIWLCAAKTEALENETELQDNAVDDTSGSRNKVETMSESSDAGDRKRRRRRRRTLGNLPAITPRSKMAAHEQLKRVSSFSGRREGLLSPGRTASTSRHESIESVTDNYVEGSSTDSDEGLADKEDRSALANGPIKRLKGNGTIYSPSSAMTAAELRRIMSSARIGSILELEQIARQERLA